MRNNKVEINDTFHLRCSRSVFGLSMLKSSMVCILLGTGHENVFVASIVSQMAVGQRGLGNCPLKVGIPRGCRPREGRWRDTGRLQRSHQVHQGAHPAKGQQVQCLTDGKNEAREYGIVYYRE